MALNPGARLGPYTVTAKIGEGGMGEVYRATDTKLKREVAIKVLPATLAAELDRLARFQREAELLASLNHPNIAAIYGLEQGRPQPRRTEDGEIRGEASASVRAGGGAPAPVQDEALTALVMELVEGEDLSQRIAQGPIPVDETLPIAKQIAEALEAAHEQGIIHRDLKPANIKVKPDGTVKVLDFGLAKAMEPTGAMSVSASMSPTLTTPAMTQAGMILGTAAYMSPEQAKGKTVDKRSDVWAFGVVLFEMLTGQRAFAGDDTSEVLAGVIKSEPNWHALPMLPPLLETFLRQCLKKDPEQRIHDIADVRLALEGAFETADSRTMVAGPIGQPALWQRPLSVAAIALATLLLGGLAVWSLNRSAPPRVARFPIPLTADQRFTYTGRPLMTVSPDGTHVVYAASNSLWLRSVDQLQAVQITRDEEDARAPFFSADSQWIGYWTGGQLKKVSIDSGAPVTVADVPEIPRGASWGSDGRILFGQREGIMEVPGAGGSPGLLIFAEEGELIHGPQMLPGGERVLFTVRVGAGSWNEAQIVAQSITTSERSVLVEGGRDGRYVATGHLVYGVGDVLFAVPFDVDSYQVVGGPVALVEGVQAARGPFDAAAMQFDVSTSGSLVYVPGAAGGDVGASSLVWVGRDGAEEFIPAPARGYEHPRVSPDGTRIAVDITDGDNTDVWIWDLTRESLTQLTFDEGLDEFPLWTPDGERVVFSSTRGGGGVFWKSADGSGLAERLKNGAAFPYAWSSDGRLFFESEGDIGLLSMEDERPVEMLLDDRRRVERAPALSPDGRWMAYGIGDLDAARIYVQPFHDDTAGQWLVSPDFGRDPVWSPDERELFYRSRTNLLRTRVETEPTFSARTPEPLFDASGYFLGGLRHYDIAPDGERFVFLKMGAPSQTSESDSFNGLIFVENWFEELKARVPID